VIKDFKLVLKNLTVEPWRNLAEKTHNHH